MEHQSKTMQQFDSVIKRCRAMFVNKMSDYGASWRIMRPSSVTDQIFIKAKRIRTLETIGHAMVDEGISAEWIAIVNYGIMGIIQLGLPATETVDISRKDALSLYDNTVHTVRCLLEAKNHDYGEAWRDMRQSSYTDMILTKLQRTKSIEDNHGTTSVSEGIDANYMDMVNYAVFALIKLDENAAD